MRISIVSGLSLDRGLAPWFGWFVCGQYTLTYLPSPGKVSARMPEERKKDVSARLAGVQGIG
jgi:hypothetical protein